MSVPCLYLQTLCSPFLFIGCMLVMTFYIKCIVRYIDRCIVIGIIGMNWIQGALSRLRFIFTIKRKLCRQIWKLKFELTFFLIFYRMRLYLFIKCVSNRSKIHFISMNRFQFRNILFGPTEWKPKEKDALFEIKSKLCQH